MIEDVRPIATSTPPVTDWAHRVELWAGTAAGGPDSTILEDTMPPIDTDAHANTIPPFASFARPEAMAEATERVLFVCQALYDAYIESCQQAIARISDGSQIMPMATPADWSSVDYNAGLTKFGKQVGLAYVDAVDRYMSIAREMLAA